MTAIRFDYQGESHKFETTAQGFLRVQARLSRSGIFRYNNSREYRADSEVFSDSALSSIKGAPVTNLHPAETSADLMVPPKT